MNQMTVSFATDMEVYQIGVPPTHPCVSWIFHDEPEPFWGTPILGNTWKHPYLQAMFKIQCRQGTMKWRTFVAVGWTLIAPHSIRFSKNAEAKSTGIPKIQLSKNVNYPLSALSITFHIQSAINLEP